MARCRAPRPGVFGGGIPDGRRAGSHPTDVPFGRLASWTVVLVGLIVAATGLVSCGNDPLPRGANQRPVAVLNVPESGLLGEALRLDASESYDPDGIVVEYHFTPGDGSATRITADPYLTYAYEEAGIFTVTLTVVDDRGGKASAVAPVSVE